MQDRQDHFAYCVQLFGGTTAFSRRIGIDERAIRRFINGEKPIGDGLYRDTAQALRQLVVEATAAEERISADLPSAPLEPVLFRSMRRDGADFGPAQGARREPCHRIVTDEQRGDGPKSARREAITAYQPKQDRL